MKSMKTTLFLSLLAGTLLSSSGQGSSVATRARFRAVREKINLLGEILEQIEQVADMAAHRELKDTLTAGRRTSHRIRQQPSKLIIYKDVLTGEDMFTNRNKITVRDDRFYEVECKTVKMSFDVDDSFIGGNRNAEVEDGGKSEPGKIGCDIVVASKLESASLIHTEGDYRGYLKKYTKNMLKYLQKNKPGRVEGFKAAAQAWAQLVLPDNFKNWKFFTGEDDQYDMEGMVPLLRVREDGGTPYMLFIKDGLVEETY
ncbi:translationally-controlled tumor protein homolog isoform X1 [Branchiostoma floridae]|uniref:Translationally-controlled tumor protein homolog isoform X1 n=1 Tax=Branchiostoma floridae TaxID=7739 RepID=A0A9J7M4B5_BRAFL|nr:translationally-controlled tumor protein homolog isoform X1 [Branchiostoma floridae]